MIFSFHGDLARRGQLHGTHLASANQGEFGTNKQVSNAAATIAVVPVLVVYCFAQRYIIEGITLTGLKA